MPASVWIRCLQLRPYLARLGVDVVINQPESEADVHVFLRRQDAAAYQLASELKQRGQRVVFDLVVNYFDEVTLPHRGTAVTETHVAQVEKMLSVSDRVICASEYIAARARARHDQVTYVPDSIDLAHFNQVKPLPDFYRSKLRAIWSGVAVKAHDLEPVLPLLARYGIDLVIVSDKRPLLTTHGRFLPRIHFYQFRRWRYQTFPDDILAGELCLSPRDVNDPYNQGHSFFKIGVFMAQGVPAIASPVPSYSELITPAGGGQICASPAEWQETIAQIVQDRERLVSWSQTARQAVLPCSTERIAAQYAALLAD